MGIRIDRLDGFLRLLCLVLTGVSACILGFNKERKEILPSLYKTATVRDSQSLWTLMIVAAVASGCESLQLLRCFLVAKFLKNRCTQKWEAWIRFLIDQGVMYTLMGTCSAALQSSVYGLHGMKKLQWMELCSMYGSFCTLNGVGLAIVVFAAVVAVVLSTISAHQLFRLYGKTLTSSSPKLKSKTSSVDQSSRSYEGSGFSIHDNELYLSS